MEKIKVGIIGVGERGCFVLGTQIINLSEKLNIEISAICDTNKQRLLDAQNYIDNLCKEKELTWNKNIVHTTNYKELIDNPNVNYVFVTCHTDQHYLPAIYTLNKNKYLYLDKPITVKLTEAQNIIDLEKKVNKKIIMGFTRRYESSWRTAYELLKKGSIGTLQMMNIHSIIPYTRYYQMWQRKTEWSGGALNDKVSHLVDVFNWMNNSEYKYLTAVGGHSNIFEPRENTPERCIYCDDYSCSYRREYDKDDTLEGTHVLNSASWKLATNDRDSADTCVYKEGCDIIDHAIVSIVYKNNIKANLFWAIYGPHAHDQETLELVGSKGRIVLERDTAKVIVHKINPGHNNEETIIIDAKDNNFKSTHFGADTQLIHDIRMIFDGKTIEELGCAKAIDGLNSLEQVCAIEKSIMEEGSKFNFEK
ncbi:MAG: Gfo/Idh/MocA family oxidoreductase [Sphaerochaetaceae bacterium]|nr:Gfo/Idh/MocA family oxidoreductase [Sphaerochaetaceae bacterium]